MLSWMYWDGTKWVAADVAEIARRASATGKTQIVTWQIPQPSSGIVETPKEPWSDLSTEGDPKGIICRPCAENAHGECEGSAVSCRCQLCSLIPTIRDMTEEWDLLDRSEGW